MLPLELNSAKTVIDSKKEGEHLSLVELLDSIKGAEQEIQAKDKRRQGMTDEE